VQDHAKGVIGVYQDINYYILVMYQESIDNIAGDNMQVSGAK